jgi:16S rRNA G1207 methylase RsmC
VSHYFETPHGTADTFRVPMSLWDAEVELESSRGVFSGRGLDVGTAVLLRSTTPPAGPVQLLDLGCGIGPITVALGLANPEAAITAVDVNDRALALTRANADRLGIGDRVRTAQPGDVPAGESYDEIWSNPPIRIGKDELHALLRLWIPRLAPGGSAWLVVQKNLGSDSLQRWLAAELDSSFSVTRESTSKSFRILRVRKASH